MKDILREIYFCFPAFYYFINIHFSKKDFENKIWGIPKTPLLLPQSKFFYALFEGTWWKEGGETNQNISLARGGQEGKGLLTERIV